MFIYFSLHNNTLFFSSEIEGEARKISVLQYRSQENAISFKILIGTGHAGDEACFNHLVGFDVSAETLKGIKRIVVRHVKNMYTKLYLLRTSSLASSSSTSLLSSSSS